LHNLISLGDPNFKQLSLQLRISSNWKKVKQSLEQANIKVNLDRFEGLSLNPEFLV
jgi:hypothetical protein